MPNVADLQALSSAVYGLVTDRAMGGLLVDAKLEVAAEVRDRAGGCAGERT